MAIARWLMLAFFGQIRHYDYINSYKGMSIEVCILIVSFDTTNTDMKSYRINEGFMII
jgi:hypothetical protein